MEEDVGPRPVDDRPSNEAAASLAPGREIRSAETDSGRRDIIHEEIITASARPPPVPVTAVDADGREVAGGWNAI